MAREDIEVHLHALQTMTEQFQAVNGGIALENYILIRK
jgi:hypothetical protein